jgi:hypothetical protein
MQSLFSWEAGDSDVICEMKRNYVKKLSLQVLTQFLRLAKMIDDSVSCCCSSKTGEASSCLETITTEVSKDSLLTFCCVVVPQYPRCVSESHKSQDV